MQNVSSAFSNQPHYICHSFVCANNSLNMSAGIPVLFCTYASSENPGINCTIWQAARATSAMPKFFKAIKIVDQTYIDGGIGLNNPTQKLLEEAQHIFPNGHVSCIISIGTGKGNIIKLPKASFIREAVHKIATDCEKEHQKLVHRFRNNPSAYLRFNVEQGLQNVSLSEWEKLANIEAHTNNYVQHEEVKRDLLLAVDALCARANVVSTALLSM